MFSFVKRVAGFRSAPAAPSVAADPVDQCVVVQDRDAEDADGFTQVHVRPMTYAEVARTTLKADEASSKAVNAPAAAAKTSKRARRNQRRERAAKAVPVPDSARAGYGAYTEELYGDRANAEFSPPHKGTRNARVVLV